MDNSPNLFFNVTDRSYFALIKKDIHRAAEEAGFSKYDVGVIDIIVAELLSNLVKHANGGSILVKADGDALEILTMDDGPGMTDVTRMMEDGVSTKSTLGQGLGAIKRLSDVFQVFSLKGWGTIVLSKKYIKAEASNKDTQFQTSAMLVSKPGEVLCGDGFYIKQAGNNMKVFFGDGLGHGAEANKAVKEAIHLFGPDQSTTAMESLRFLHAHVKKTRGMVGVAALLKDKRWRICGIGNIHTRIYSQAGLRTYMGYNGVLGLNIPTSLKDLEIELEKGMVIIFCSDGIKTRWDLVKYPNIFKYELSILLAVIFKDNARKTDDMSLLAIRCI